MVVGTRHEGVWHAQVGLRQVEVYNTGDFLPVAEDCPVATYMVMWYPGVCACATSFKVPATHTNSGAGHCRLESKGSLTCIDLFNRLN